MTILSKAALFTLFRFSLMFDLPVSTSTATFSPGILAKISIAPLPFTGCSHLTLTTVNSNVKDETEHWGHPSAEVFLLVSKNRGYTFSVFGISPPDSSVPNWLPNLERPTRHQAVKLPSLIYRHGHRGKTNKQIMSNEVVWCDLASLLAQ